MNIALKYKITKTKNGNTVRRKIALNTKLGMYQNAITSYVCLLVYLTWL